MSHFSEKILKYGSFTLVFLAPVIFWSHGLYPHISSKTFFIYGVVEILFSIWIYFVFLDKSYRIPRRTLFYFLPLLGFIFWMTVSGIFGENPSLSFWSSLGRGTGLLTLYHCLAFSFVMASLVRKGGFTYLASLFQWFISGSFILALSVWMGSDGFSLPVKVLQTDGGGGLSGNSTLAAGYFLFTLAMTAFLFSEKSISIGKKWLMGITTAVVIFSPVFANLYGFFTGRGILGTARGTILALAAGIVATGIGYMFLSGRKVVRGFSVAIVAIGIVTFSFLWVQLITPNTYLNNKFSDEARGSRFIFWDVAEKAMNKHSIIGYGPENYTIAFQEYFDPQILVSENSFEGWSDRAHNIFYDLGVTGGYPVIILYAIFIISIFLGTYKLYKDGGLGRVQVSIISGLLIAYISNNLFTFDSNLSLLSLFSLVGIIYGLDKSDTKQKSLPVHINESSKNIIAFILLILLVISEVFFVYIPAMKSRVYAETFAAPINKRPDMYAKLLDGSRVGEQWEVSDMAFSTYKIYASNPASLKADKDKLPYLIKNLDELISYLYKVSERNKTDYRLHLTIVLLENTLTYMSDRPYSSEIRDRMLTVLEKARNLSPTNPNVYWNMAQTKIWGGDLEGAEEAYRQAVIIAPHIPSSYNLFLNYAKIVGNKKLFDEIIIQAKKNIPGYEFK